MFVCFLSAGFSVIMYEYDCDNNVLQMCVDYDFGVHVSHLLQVLCLFAPNIL